MRNLVHSLALALVTSACFAQERVLVRLETNYPAAIVYADQLLLGPAYQENFYVAPGTARLRLVAPEPYGWSIAPIEAALEGESGDTLDLHLDFPSHHRVETVPFGASVYWVSREGRTRMGTTPLVFASSGTGSMALELAGFQGVRIEALPDVWNTYRIELRPDAVHTGAGRGGLQTYRRRRWIDYCAAGLAIAGGVLSVHHKFKADRLDRQYSSEADPLLVPRIRRLDTRAALSLGVMQVGLGTLAFRFIIR